MFGGGGLWRQLGGDSGAAVIDPDVHSCMYGLAGWKEADVVLVPVLIQVSAAVWSSSALSWY